VENHLYCIYTQYNSPVDEMTPTQWIAKCAERLHERWVTVGQAQLEETAVVIWNDTQLRALPPDQAAAKWLSPVTTATE
jgi:hypothetical protein